VFRSEGVLSVATSEDAAVCLPLWAPLSDC